MGINRLNSIVRAARGKPARGGKERRNKYLVSTNKTNEYILHKNEQAKSGLYGQMRLKKSTISLERAEYFR